MPVGSLAYQPPDGKQILFIGDQDLVQRGEMYLVNADGSNLRTLVSSEAPILSEAVWSPDGSQIAYGEGGRIHVMAADGSDDRVLPSDFPGWRDWPKWSPDGTRLVVHGDNGIQGAVNVIRADGTGPTVRIATAVAPNGYSYEWSPDSTMIFARTFNDPQHQEIWDPATGAVRAAPWGAATNPTWQRLAP